MPIKNTFKEIGETALMNGTVLSVATFSNLELGLKILLLVITIVYTFDKWIYHKKQRNEKEKTKQQKPEIH